MQFAYKKHKGLVREEQEDSMAHWPKTSKAAKEKLFAVADGLGGLPDGEIASSNAVKAVMDYTSEHKGIESLAELKAAVMQAQQAVDEQNKDRNIDDYMATTLTLAYLNGDQLWVAHVGDCRLYRVRDQKLELLTEDHAIDRYTLSRAVGFPGEFKVDTKKLKVREGDQLLLCSDGLYGMVEENDLLQPLLTHQDASAAVDALLKSALDNGGHDNISIYVIQI